MMKERAMAQSEDSMMTRPIDEMVTTIHDRAAAIRRRRFHKRALASIGGLAVVTAIALALIVPTTPTPSQGHKTATTSARAHQLAQFQRLIQLTAGGSSSPSVEPPFQPIDSGWSAAEPSLPSSLPSKWSPLVTSAFKVFEHETQNGQSATLTWVAGQNPSEVNTPAGPTVLVYSLNGLITAEEGGSGIGQGGNWIMTATSTEPFSDGGSATFIGGCTWIPTASTGTQRSATCTYLTVNLVGDPTNPYSATVSKWTATVGASRIGP
jgi:hypothetical protein